MELPSTIIENDQMIKKQSKTEENSREMVEKQQKTYTNDDNKIIQINDTKMANRTNYTLIYQENGMLAYDRDGEL